MTTGTHNGNYIDFYGCLKDIIMLQYNSDSRTNRTVVLFRCDWFDNDDAKKQSRMKDDGYMRSINQGSFWFKDDPFIFATQATKVFYLDDTKHQGSWRVVQKFAHRHLFCVGEQETDIQLSYQDDECVSFEVRPNEGNLDNEQDSGDNPVTIDASVVHELHRQRDLEQEVDGYESSDSEDETGGQYATDGDEGNTVNGEQDEEDDSDGD